MKKAAIFDQDGLMFDTEKVWGEAWYEVAQDFGVTIPEGFIRAVRGCGKSQSPLVVERFMPEVDGIAFRDAAIERTFKKEEEEGLELKPGLTELLEFFKEREIPMIVASSSGEENVRMNLKRTGLSDYFSDIVADSDIERGKPDPQIFLVAAKKLGFAPQDCYVLEDSLNGVRAGHDAGCFTIMVPDLVPPDEEIKRLYDACAKTLLEVRDRIAAGEF